MRSSSSSSSIASDGSSSEDVSFLQRVRHIRLPQPPPDGPSENGDEVAHLVKNDSASASVIGLARPSSALAPRLTLAAKSVLADTALPVPTASAPLAAAAEPTLATAEVPPPTAPVVPVRPAPAAPSASFVETDDGTVTGVANSNVHNDRLPVPQGPSTAVGGVAPLEHALPGPATVPLAASSASAALPPARPPALTVTVLTEPPPGSRYADTSTVPATVAAGDAYPEREKVAVAELADRRNTAIVAVKRQKKPLEGRDVRLFAASSSSTSDDEDESRARSLLDFLGNVVSTADTTTRPSCPSRPGAAEEEKKRQKRRDRERRHPALIIRQEDVQNIDAGDSPEKKVEIAASEPSVSSQSTNALTPDQKVKAMTEVPAPTATSPTMPVTSAGTASPASQHVDRHHHVRHHRCGETLRDSGAHAEGFSPTRRHSGPRQDRRRVGTGDAMSTDVDILVDVPKDDQEENGTPRPSPISVRESPASTFVRHAGSAYDGTATKQPWRVTRDEVEDPRLSATTELLRKGFCKSGAFDGDTSSTQTSAASQRPAGPSTTRLSSPPPLPEYLYVTVSGMSPLHADVNVVHPFARVWLVNGRTGENCVSARSGAPFAITQLFDLRQRQSRAPHWEAEVALPLHHATLRKAPKETVLLVEVLDVCTETVTGEFVPRSGMYPICWGYYYLYDRYGNMNVGVENGANLHLQMFRFPLRTSWWTQFFSSVLPPALASRAVWAPVNYLASGSVLHTPNMAVTEGDDRDECAGETRTGAASASSSMQLGIFAIFRSVRNRKIPYKAGLAVSVRFVRAETGARPRVAQATEYEEHLLRQLAAMAGNCVVPRLHDTPSGVYQVALPGNESSRVPVPRRLTTQAEHHCPSLCVVDKEALTYTYERVGTAERCLPPTHMIQTCPVPGALSCMTFTHAGTLLALGVTRHLQYVVELRLPLLAELPVAARLTAHTGHIHHLAFNADDTKLLSCASDQTVRIWMGNDGYNFADVSPQVRTLRVSCVCVLPHRWPIYTATFHSFQLHRRRHTTDEYVITGGYSNKIVTWKLSDAPHHRSPLSSAGSDTALPAVLAPTGECDGRQACELVSRVSVADSAFVLEIASTNGSHRVWSIDSSGTVICWRATIDADGFEMSVRMRSPELACTRILVSASTVLAFKPNSAAVFLFDATSGKSLRNKPPPVATDCNSFALLPDGSGFVGGTSRGRLRCWNWETSTLFHCTSQHGYRGTEVAYPIERIAWAPGEHLVATASPAPCPECYLNDILLPRVRPADRPGVVALPPFDLSQLEVTLLTIAGAPQPSNDLHPPTLRLVDFVRLFGGDAVAVQRARAAQTQRSASPGQHTSVLVERFEEDDTEDPANVLSRAMAQVDAQLNSIVQFWRRAFGGTAQTNTADAGDRYRETALND